MVARVGRDMFGDATVANFAALGIDTRHVRVLDGVSSGVAPIFVEPSGQNRIIVVKGANDWLTPAELADGAPVLDGAHCVVLQFEIPIDTVVEGARMARERGIRVIVNPAPATAIDLARLRGADYLMPNETEAEMLTGMPVRSESDAAACATALLGSGVKRVIITLGPRGAFVAGEGGSQLIPAFPVSPVDTTGAGDAFIGSFATFLAEGIEEREAIARANLYAGLSTTAVGTQKSFWTREAFEREWSATLSR
jgi:ribokinase